MTTAFSTLSSRLNQKIVGQTRLIERLGLDVETIVGIHGRPAPMTQFNEFVAAGQ